MPILATRPPSYSAFCVRLGVALALVARAGAYTGTCGVLRNRKNLFCSGVSWNASLPLPAAELDAAAKTDFDLAIERLYKVGAGASLPMCLESWKALQCASKFQRCSKPEHGLPRTGTPLKVRGRHPCFPGNAASTPLATSPRAGVPQPLHGIRHRVQRLRRRPVRAATARRRRPSKIPCASALAAQFTRFASRVAAPAGRAAPTTSYTTSRRAPTMPSRGLTGRAMRATHTTTSSRRPRSSSRRYRACRLCSRLACCCCI